MKPLCKKIYIDKIVEIIVLIIGTVLDILFVINVESNLLWLIITIPVSAMLLCFFNRRCLLDLSTKCIDLSI